MSDATGGPSAAVTPQPGADTPADIPPRGWKEIAVATWKNAGKDNIPLIASGVAFYAFLALVPLLTALVLTYGLVAEPSSVVGHMRTLTEVMPSQAAEIIGGQLKSMTETSGGKTGFALIVALALALYGASKGASAIVTALNIVWSVEETRGFIARTLLSLVMTAGAVLILLAAILSISALNFVETLLPNIGGVVHFLLQILSFLGAGAAIVLLLAVIYRYGPNRPNAPWRWITPGSALATLVWLAATFGFGLYVSNFGNYNATYGSLGAIIVFLTWLYLTFYIVLLGAELNAMLEVKVGAKEAASRAGGGKVEEDGSTARQGGPVTASASTDEGPSQKGDQPTLGSLIGRLTTFTLLGTLLGRGRATRVYR